MTAPPRVAGLQSGPDLDAELAFLRATLAADGGPVECVETHLSWVLLAGRRVLKLKKRIGHGVTDFSTLAARERNAREELRLNRRLAADVYQGLIAVDWDGERFALRAEGAGPPRGEVVDWLVAMRRLPEHRMLHRVIASGALKSRDVEALVEVLVRFYRTAAPATLDASEHVARLRAELAASRRVLELPAFALAAASGLCDGVEKAISLHEPELRARVRDGRIVDGHGDLRPEHVCLVEPPVIIDALEFDARLRQVDPFDELSFLGLECAVAGDAGLGPRIVERCARELGDDPPPALLSLYAASRALIRARLSAAHLLDGQVRTPAKWLPQTERYLGQAALATARLAAGSGG